MPDATVNAAGLRIVKLLVGNAPQTIPELIKVTGVTRTAVTEQLNELVASGFVERSLERLPGRGRPRNLYSATDAALALLFVGNQRLVVPAIWRAIHNLGGEKLTRKVCRQVSRALAEHYNGKITAERPRERLQQFMNLLSVEGGLIEAVEDDQGQLVLHKRSCPFISMVDQDRNVCHIDLEVMNAVVGQRVRQTACRHEGAPCCTFELVDENGTC